MEERYHLFPGVEVSFFLVDRKEQEKLKHYHGIRIEIDLSVNDNPLISYLKHCGCSLLEELYRTDPEQRLQYLQVKMPELFYHLKCQKTEDVCECKTVTRLQIELVKAVSDYISEHLHEKITVKQLTMKYGVSDTCLQNAFRGVYGMPVIRFIRTQKMQNAAQVLIHTTRTIEEIAEMFGYENESKFAGAFKKIMGDPPGAYRRKHTKGNGFLLE